MRHSTGNGHADWVCRFRRPAVIFDHSLGDAKETVAYAISAVYCPPEHRGKGYASHMMRLLHYVLASSEALPPFPPEWGGPPPAAPANILPGSFSALYSDIGPNFYQLCGPGGSRAGWTVRGHSQTVWQTRLFERRTDQLRWLSIEDCIRVWHDDAIYVKQQVACKSQNRGSCAFLPSAGVAAFQIRRAIFLFPGLPVPQKWGVQIEGLSEPTYATWITNSTAPQHVALLVTRIRATPNTFSLLLSAIMEAATENKCGFVEIWSLDPALSDEAQKLGGVEVEREHNLPSLAWYGLGDPDKVEFMFNERFAYC